ncbi:hypothetical protein FGADI_9229 [Fusarium gaditjirri]|uniref:Uncharacterized protein n=1 Tax=Fusarium gaditjirri TaxID=282569 RepID=A0A8H4T0A4_9HYPO|nr:hypothetical protein FGADI_9229 [Fusarium gaditjirri]
MANETQPLSAVKRAKRAVRLKGKHHEYGETQDFDVFLSRGGKPHELMDEERYLDFPAKTSASAWKGITIDNDESSSQSQSGTAEERIIWSPKQLTSIGEGSNSIKATVRKVGERHLAFELAARVCDGSRLPNDKMKKLMGIKADYQHSMDKKASCVYVGISALNCKPIFMMKSDTQNSPESFDGVLPQEGIKASLDYDNTAYVKLVTDPEGYVLGHQIIWTENMLIPGNISYIKRALHGCLASSENNRFLQLVKREHSLILAGIGPSGVAKVLPSNEAPARQPLLRRAIQGGKDYTTLHFILRWPPIALLQFPQDMIEEMQGFLNQHPHDNVPLNIALAATIIYFDIEESDDHQREGFLDSFPKKPALVKKAPLVAFIILFPHMLRFVETHHLTSFIHPFRFANTQNSIRHPPRVSATRSDLNPTSMRSWYYQIRSRHPQVSADYRLTLIPASMPGTTMIFPKDCNHAQKPSPDLFKLCCLNDVRTLGLPNYSYNGNRAFKWVGGPIGLFSEAVRQTKTSCYRLEGIPSTDYWKAYHPGEFSALTGLARKIGLVFPDVGSDYYNKETITSCVERWFGVETTYTENFQFCDETPELERKKMATRADELIRIADRLGIPSAKRRTSHKTMLLEWDGMEGHLKSLHEQGKLKRFAAPDYPTPPAKRAKAAEPVLGSDIKEQILQITKGLAAASCDWDNLLKDLQTSAPTMKAIQKSFTPVRLFVSELEKTLQSENGGSGEGDLDHIIRLVFRAEGLFGSGVEGMDYESKWGQHRDRLSQLFG